jgi:hypothetical protein
MSNNNKLVDFLNVYNHTFTIPSTQKVITYKPISTGQMKKLLIYENSKDPLIIEQILDELINGCVITENFDINDLYLQDRFGLLLDIRKTSKGNTYTFNFKCPDCKKISLNNIKIDKLKVVEYPKNIDHHIELFDGFSFDLGFIKRGDQRKAIDVISKKDLTDKQKIIEVATYSYALNISNIVTPEGPQKTDVDMIFEFLDALNETLYSKIADWYKKYEYGIEFKYKCVCPFCKEEKIIDIPITNFFG